MGEPWLEVSDGSLDECDIRLDLRSRRWRNWFLFLFYFLGGIRFVVLLSLVLFLDVFVFVGGHGEHSKNYLDDASTLSRDTNTQPRDMSAMKG